MADRCYVYAIVHRGVSLPAGPAGFGDGGLVAVPWRELAAVTSRIGDGMIEATPDRLDAHEAVVEAVSRVANSLPVRFGTVLPGSVAVADAIAVRYGVLRDDLKRLGGKVEYGLTVLWNPPEPGVANSARLSQFGPGSRYLASRFYSYQHELAVRDAAFGLAGRVDGVLKERALERRCTVLPTSRLLMRADYLVEPHAAGELRMALEQAQESYPGLRFLLTGPWPPYSFVTAQKNSGGMANLPEDYCGQYCDENKEAMKWSSN